MLFRTIDHYDELLYDENRENPECFICYEVDVERIQLHAQKEYIRTCECNGFIHRHCLRKWIEHSMKCPICRKYIAKQRAPHNTNSHLLLRKLILTFPSMMAILAFIYYTCEFYASIVNSKQTYEHSCLLYENSTDRDI